MFQEFLPLMPKEAGTLAYAMALTGTLIGVGLWLAGSRFSRSLITLVMVSAGGWIGMFCRAGADGASTAGRRR